MRLLIALPVVTLLFAVGSQPPPQAPGPSLLPSFAADHTDMQLGVTADTLRGGDQDDVLRGGEGDDLLEGGAGNDRLVGLGGDDVLRGGAGRDDLEGGAGSDVLEGGDGDDVLTGGEGRDWLFGEDGDDVLRAGAGDDVLEGGEGRDQLDGGDGNDVLDGDGGDDVVYGGGGDDQIDGGDGSDILIGGDGNDNLDGEDDNDILLGGAANDTLIGADGSDNLDGGPGDDFLDGGDGADILIGGTGNDFLIGYDGADHLDGGAGDDALGGGDGNDMIIGGAGNDFLSGGEGDDVMRGGPGADTLFGWTGSDDLRGGPDSDYLRGGPGDDVLNGDAGADWLLGGIGTDQITGGPGSDVVMLRAGDVSRDRIESVDGGTTMDTVVTVTDSATAVADTTITVSSDTLVLNGFDPGDISPIAGFSDSVNAFLLADPLTGGVYAVTGFEEIVYMHFFADISMGAGVSSVLHLTNPSRDDAVSGRVDFVADDGTPLAVAINGNSPQTSFTISIPPLGSIDLATAGSGEPLRASVRIQADRPVGGVVETALPELGSVGVAESQFLSGFIAPAAIDRDAGISTRITVMNGATETSLKLTLGAGQQEVEATDIPVPANARFTGFVHELFPRVSDFEGFIVIEGGPMAAAAVQLRSGGDEVLMSPLIPYVPTGLTGTVFFPHIANGDGVVSSIMLLNIPQVQGDTVRGRLDFFDDAGNPWEIDLEGLGSVSSVPLTLTAGTQVFTTSGEGAMVTGSARVVFTEEGFDGGLLHVGFPGVGRVGFSPSRPIDGFISPVKRNEEAGVTTMVALHSTGSDVTLNLTLRDASGRAISRGTASMRIPANGHAAQRIEEIFPRASLANFQGTLTVEGGMVAAMVLQLGSARGEAIVLPVTPIY